MKKFIANLRKLQLKRKDFTVFSNNCLSAFIYKRYNLPFLTPTISIHFKPNEFIKFCKNYKHYFSVELTETKEYDKEWYASLGGCEEPNCPIGKLDDLTLYFQHSKTFEDAKRDWDRRKARVVDDNLFFILFDMSPSIEIAEEFETIESDKKLYLYHKGNDLNTKSSFRIRGLENTTRTWWSKMNRFNPFSKKYYEQFDYTKWLNGNYLK